MANEYLRSENQRLAAELERQNLIKENARLKAKLNMDPEHPKVEGWEWDSDFGYVQSERRSKFDDLLV